MPTTKIILFKHKAKKNNEAPLYLRLIKDRKPKYVSLKLYVLPKYWDADKEKVKPSHPNSVRINNYLAERTRAALDSILETETDDPSAPAAVLKYSVMGVSNEDFFTFSYKLIKQYQSKGQIGSYKKYISVLKKLKDFIGQKEFTFNQLTLKFIKDFEYHMRTSLKNKSNTIVSNLKGIRHLIAEAVKENVIPAKRNPFLYYKMQWKQSERIFLTEEEIEAIANLELPSNSMKYHVRNIYIFACFAGGIRVADLLSLKWVNFSGDHILLSTQKTGSVISVKLPKRALSILELYQNDDAKKDDYIFPFLEKYESTLNPTDFFARTISIKSNINIHLKTIAKMAGIEKHVHFHTSRHTWATRALRKGMRIEYVSKLMGHNSIRTTQIYAKIVNADLDKAMEIFDE